MKLVFKLEQQFGRNRYYPMSQGARAIVDITGRKCLKQTEIELLTFAGFQIEVLSRSEALV